MDNVEEGTLFFVQDGVLVSRRQRWEDCWLAYNPYRTKAAAQARIIEMLTCRREDGRFEFPVHARFGPGSMRVKERNPKVG